MFSKSALLAAIAAGVVAQHANAAVVISEIMYNPAGADGSNPVSEWVEIYNSGDAAVDISGWRLDDEDAPTWAAFASGTTLGPKQVAVIIDSAHASESLFRATWQVPSEALVLPVVASTLANTASVTNEVLVLLDAGSNIVDTANFEAGTNGWPASTNGKSIYTNTLTPAGNDIGANWLLSEINVDFARQPLGGAADPDGKYSINDIGSPGNVVIPEPASLSLLALGALAVGRRRR